MGMVAVYLNGGYLDKVLHHDHARVRIDFAKLVREMVNPTRRLHGWGRYGFAGQQAYHHGCRFVQRR